MLSDCTVEIRENSEQAKLMTPQQGKMANNLEKKYKIEVIVNPMG
jgi:hypothetical protein